MYIAIVFDTFLDFLINDSTHCNDDGDEYLHYGDGGSYLMDRVGNTNGNSIYHRFCVNAAAGSFQRGERMEMGTHFVYDCEQRWSCQLGCEPKMLSHSANT